MTAARIAFHIVTAAICTGLCLVVGSDYPPIVRVFAAGAWVLIAILLVGHARLEDMK